MDQSLDMPVEGSRRFAFIREETRFEIGLLHDRVNALIAAEAFLTIVFTMAMGNPSARLGLILPVLVAPVLALLGLTLAIMAWPGIDASFKIIAEWNLRQLLVMREYPVLSDSMWRLSVRAKGNLRADPDQRRTMLFARAAPAIFAAAWAILIVVAVILPWLR